jgi:hypothetical protein
VLRSPHISTPIASFSPRCAERIDNRADSRIPDIIAAKMGYIMSSLQISQGTFRLSDTRTLKIADLTYARVKAGRLSAATAAVNPRWRARWPAS